MRPATGLAVEASIQVVLAFARLRGLLATHAELAGKLDELERRYDAQFKVVFEAIAAILEMFDELVGRLLDAGKRVCLTCYERHPDDCHRGVLAERWRRGSWREVEHLGADESCHLIRV